MKERIEHKTHPKGREQRETREQCCRVPVFKLAGNSTRVPWVGHKHSWHQREKRTASLSI